MTIPSPNIWHHTQTYEVENRAVDPAGLIWQDIEAIQPLADLDVVDVGCGTAFHAAGFVARGVRSWRGVEPHPPLLQQAQARIAGQPDLAARCVVLPGQAQQLPIENHSVDLVHARWAYFFGPGCEPGLAEVNRVLRPGGVACFVDIDQRVTEFGAAFQDWGKGTSPQLCEAFWARQGFQRRRLVVPWVFENREQLRAVLHIELPQRFAERVLARTPGFVMEYGVNIWWRRY